MSKYKPSIKWIIFNVFLILASIGAYQHHDYKIFSICISLSLFLVLIFWLRRQWYYNRFLAFIILMLTSSISLFGYRMYLYASIALILSIILLLVFSFIKRGAQHYRIPTTQVDTEESLLNALPIYGRGTRGMTTSQFAQLHYLTFPDANRILHKWQRRGRVTHRLYHSHYTWYLRTDW